MDLVAVSEWAESRFPLYALESIHSLYATSNMPMYKLHEHLATLIAVAGGKGVLKTADGRYELQEGSVVLLPANMPAVLVADLSQPLHAYKLAIGTRQPSSAVRPEALTRKSEAAEGSVIVYFSNEPEIAALAEELYVHRLPGSEVRHARNQIVLHQIILRLLEGKEARHAADEQLSMERSIAYLEERFDEKITRERLAEIAGVSASHYSTLFKQLTGFSLSDYLSRLRVHRAKELLIGGSATLREIALKVGYKDEFYLSRRFKQQSGTSPSAYGRGAIARVAVWLAPYAGHLQLLGAAPAVFISESSEYLMTDELLPVAETTFVHAASSAEHIQSVLLANRIELVIAAGLHLREYGLNSDRLRVAAPVAEVPWMEIGWKEHLRMIGRLIQKTERAERWLAAFEEEERVARETVRQSGAADEVISILVIKPDQLFAYGVRNAGYAIYRSLGIRPPRRIAQEIDKLGDQFHSVPIGPSELAEYAGDRIFVIVFPDEKGSTAHCEAVFESDEWRSLAAVKRGKVHTLDHEEWIPYNPVSIRLQLRRAVALLAGDQ